MPRPSSILPPLLALFLGLFLQPLLTSFSSSNLTITPLLNEGASKPFLSALSHRRSVYTLSNSSTISDERIIEILEQTIEKTPAAFGSFTTRMVLLLRDSGSVEGERGIAKRGGGAQERMWDLVERVLREKFEQGGKDESEWEQTRVKIDGFRMAYGTILFYEDPENIELLQAKFPSYFDKFPQWSEHTNAMHQLVVWTALEAEGLGASLQHYNPLVDPLLSSEPGWNISSSWKLIAQMPFGTPTAWPEPKPDGNYNGMKKPLEERLRVLKGSE